MPPGQFHGGWDAASRPKARRGQQGPAGWVRAHLVATALCCLNPVILAFLELLDCSVLPQGLSSAVPSSWNAVPLLLPPL